MFNNPYYLHLKAAEVLMQLEFTCMMIGICVQYAKLWTQLPRL